jgi:hypothetical protein
VLFYLPRKWKTFKSAKKAKFEIFLGKKKREQKKLKIEKCQSQKMFQKNKVGKRNKPCREEQLEKPPNSEPPDIMVM